MFEHYLLSSKMVTCLIYITCIVREKGRGSVLFLCVIYRGGCFSQFSYYAVSNMPVHLQMGLDTPLEKAPLANYTTENV